MSRPVDRLKTTAFLGLVLAASLPWGVGLCAEAHAAEGRLADFAAFDGSEALTWPNGVPRPIPKPVPEAELLPSFVLPQWALPRASYSGGAPLPLPFVTPRGSDTQLTAPGMPLPLPLGGDATMTLAPTLRFNPAIPSSPNDQRIAIPQAPRIDPTPGLNATINMGDFALGTTLNRPVKSQDSAVSPDGKPISATPNMGVDLKMKF